MICSSLIFAQSEAGFIVERESVSAVCCRDYPSACSELCCQMETVYKSVCVAATLARAVGGNRAGHYNIQRAGVKWSVKSVIGHFTVLRFMVNCAIPSDSIPPVNQSASAVAYAVRFPFAVRISEACTGVHLTWVKTILLSVRPKSVCRWTRLQGYKSYVRVLTDV